MPTSPVPPAPTPSVTDQIHAIRTVQAEQAGKIGAACAAYVSKGTAIDPVALGAEMQILAGLDLAAAVLQAGV